MGNPMDLDLDLDLDDKAKDTHPVPDPAPIQTLEVPPHIRQRKAHVQQFLASLSPQEIRDAVPQLAGYDFRIDIVARIPVELCLIIAKYVDAEDIYNFTNVSRQWRAIWLDHHAVRVLARRHQPAFLPFVEAKQQLGGTQGTSMAHEFREAMRKLRATQTGKFQSVLSVDLHNLNRNPFPLDPTFHPDPSELAGYEEVVAACKWPEESDDMDYTFPLGMVPYDGVHLYHDGKHAWSSKRGSHVIVDDFRSQLRRVYSVPGSALRGIQLLPLALGDKLLVTRSDRHVYAFDLDTGTLDTFTMPNLPTRASTCRNTICLFSASETVMWTFGGGRSTTLDISHLASHLGDLTAISRHNVLFHPLREDLLFLEHSPKNNTRNRTAARRIVSEYKDGVFVKIHHVQFPKFQSDDNPVLSEGLNIDRMDQRIRQISPYGDYALHAIWYYCNVDGNGNK
ncbi:hypothetical protein QBC39DRAFT_370705 [Podospora conica]|nr:hypothetical protein QBC39DRAFT_370705 [Schizothecium conicum]